uniref:hypothetical protein n=1 Tax=Streptomyces polyasparticus TaxID=2767826 RepID=UPI001BE3E22D|nr:hypothetical protein [Streptomyces polyasparticus]
MHRTTRAALLLSLTVTAVSGCVAVKSPAAPPTTPSGPAAAPSAKGHAEPQIVQAPAHEALERVRAEEQERAPQAPGVVRTPAAEPAPVREAAPDAVRESGAAPHADTAPALPRAQPPGALPSTAVCTLGEQYGGWPADSPQALICRGAYGG